MSYCNKIKSEKIYNMADNELDLTLDDCYLNCDKYSSCDTVALMNYELKVKEGELLCCPHCEHYMEFCDCPDLFYSDASNSKGLNEQLKLLEEMQTHGYNIVTCGNCGQVFIHRT